jgi:hypothetical protein
MNRMISKFISWSREFTAAITVHKNSFVIKVPMIQEIRKYDNITTILKDNEIIIIGNYVPEPNQKLQ